MNLQAAPLPHAPVCPHCRVSARLAVGPYGRRWECPEAGCDARVGIHRDSRSATPLGTMARAPLRVLRMRAHAALDPLWKAEGATYSRKQAYAWLAGLMGIDAKACHIAKFDEAECRRALLVLQDAGRLVGSICACRGCETPIATEHLVCDFHWRKISPPTRRLLGLIWDCRSPADAQPHEDWPDLALQAVSEANGGGL